ncbi:MAG: transporter related protein [Pseudonocardiales bacterium]|nr:transporter related protein [Pseudonocardiales bacterium]
MTDTIDARTPQHLLTIDGLRVAYRGRRGEVRAVDGVDLAVGAGQVVAVVGESGSGKSTLAHAVIGLLPAGGRIDAGRISFAGRDGEQDLARLSERKLRALRGRDIGLIPQDPSVSLNPTTRIGAQVAEVLIVHGLANSRNAHVEAVQALADAGLPDPATRAQQFPHELSGGMRQRVLIAIAFAANPRLVIADEPTSALDVTVQKRILDHLGMLVQSRGTSILLITHDLGVAAGRADQLIVMSRGRVVEAGRTADILDNPQHEYTRKLLSDAPSMASGSLIAGRRTATATDTATARERGGSADDAGAATPVPLLQVSHVVKHFPLPRRGGGERVLKAVDDVSFSIERGRTLALVGESGSGKSTTARLSIALTAPTSGSIVFDGLDLVKARSGEIRRARQSMQIVYQNPYTSLSPRLTVSQIVEEPLRIFRVGSKAERRAAAADLIDQVALPASVLSRRAAELSGGQRQRVAIARALALSPSLVVCDEPVSALDVTVQSQILALLVDLQAERNLSYLFISHDLAVVRQIADDVAVMRNGQIVEAGPTQQIYAAPQHEYTQELLNAVPTRAARTTRPN